MKLNPTLSLAALRKRLLADSLFQQDDKGNIQHGPGEHIPNSYTSCCETVLECQQTGSLGLAPALEAESSPSHHKEEAPSHQQVDFL